MGRIHLQGKVLRKVSNLMFRVKRHIPAMLYTLLSLLGLALLLDGALGSDWVFCRLTSALCVSGLGLVGTLLLALYGALGLLICVAFAAMLYRVLRQGGARAVPG